MVVGQQDPGRISALRARRTLIPQDVAEERDWVGGEVTQCGERGLVRCSGPVGPVLLSAARLAPLRQGLVRLPHLVAHLEQHLQAILMGHTTRARFHTGKLGMHEGR